MRDIGGGGRWLEDKQPLYALLGDATVYSRHVA